MAGIIQDPAGFVPLHAVSFGGIGTPAVPVDGEHPLPVVAMRPIGTSTPLSATVTVSGTAGPFTPDLGWPVWLTLTGNWSGNVRLLRSVDGGTTKLPLTIAGQDWASFTGNVQEIVGEESSAGTTWYLAITLTGGTLTYRVAQ